MRHNGVRTHLKTWLSSIDALVLTTNLTAEEATASSDGAHHVWLMGSAGRLAGRRYLQLLPLAASRFPDKAWYIYLEDDVIVNIPAVQNLLAAFDASAAYWIAQRGCAAAVPPIRISSAGLPSVRTPCMSQMTCLSSAACQSASHACPDGDWKNTGGMGAFFSRGFVRAISAHMMQCAGAVYHHVPENKYLDTLTGTCLNQAGFASTSVEFGTGSAHAGHARSFIWWPHVAAKAVRSISNENSSAACNRSAWQLFTFHVSARQNWTQHGVSSWEDYIQSRVVVALDRMGAAHEHNGKMYRELLCDKLFGDHAPHPLSHRWRCDGKDVDKMWAFKSPNPIRPEDVNRSARRIKLRPSEPYRIVYAARMPSRVQLPSGEAGGVTEIAVRTVWGLPTAVPLTPQDVVEPRKGEALFAAARRAYAEYDRVQRWWTAGD
jgi:hypothetical protein